MINIILQCLGTLSLVVVFIIVFYLIKLPKRISKIESRLDTIEDNRNK